jgi:hypothetical protein
MLCEEVRTVCHSHEGITNRLNLEDFVFVRQRIKCNIKTIQHIPNFHSRQRTRNIRESDDLTEEYSDIVMRFTKRKEKYRERKLGWRSKHIQTLQPNDQNSAIGYLRLDLLAGFELVGHLLREHFVQHISSCHFRSQSYITLLYQRFRVMGGHVREAPIEILGFRTIACVAAPALFHDFCHSLGTSPRDGWSVIDPRITYLPKDLSRVLAFVGDLSAVDLIENHSYKRHAIRR